MFVRPFLVNRTHKVPKPVFNCPFLRNRTCGVGRARADHRQQALQPSPSYLPPYRTLYTRNRKDSIIYKVSVAYSPWMEHASLVLMRERRDCCRIKMLGVEPVITDLALTSPFHVPQGQISVSQVQMAVSQGQAVNLPEQTAIPQAVTERDENAANRQETQSRPDCMVRCEFVGGRQLCGCLMESEN